MDVPHIAGNYVTGAWHFYDFLSGDHDRLIVKWPSALVCGRRGPRAPDARHRPRNAGPSAWHSLAMDAAVAHADGLLAPSRRYAWHGSSRLRVTVAMPAGAGWVARYRGAQFRSNGRRPAGSPAVRWWSSSSAATTGTSAARRRDDAAPTEYASSLVFTTRQRSPSGHLDGRGRRLGARSRLGYVQPGNLRDRTYGARHYGPWQQARACAVRGAGALVAYAPPDTVGHRRTHAPGRRSRSSPDAV